MHFACVSLRIAVKDHSDCVVSQDSSDWRGQCLDSKSNQFVPAEYSWEMVYKQLWQKGPSLRLTFSFFAVVLDLSEMCALFKMNLNINTQSISLEM